MISVVIPTLNEEREIGTTLHNLKELMERKEIEVIVSDGGSTDTTAEIARAYTPHVIVYEGTERQTIAAGRNLGAKQAKGEYLLFLDADVVVPDPSRALKEIVARFERDPGLVGLTVFVKVRAADATIADRLIFGFMNYFVLVINNVFRFGGGPGEFLFMRTDVFRKIDGFREDLPVAEDYDLFRRLKRVGRLTTYSRLTVLHSGRRAHKIGWPRLLFMWAINNIYVILFSRSAHKEWVPVR